MDKTPQENHGLALTGLEGDILQSIEHVGWHAHLWFPIVQRRMLNIVTDAPDEQIHAAIVGLIRKRTLIYGEPEGWRLPNWSPAPDVSGPILESPGYLRLAYRMPLVPPGPAESLLGSGFGSYQLYLCDAKGDAEPANCEDFVLTELEAQILQSIDHVGWYPYLWFPVVAREMLNFGSVEREESVHAAILGLIRKRGLVVTSGEPGDIPQWSPAPGILIAAERRMGEVRALHPPLARSIF